MLCRNRFKLLFVRVFISFGFNSLRINLEGFTKLFSTAFIFIELISACPLIRFSPIFLWL